MNLRKTDFRELKWDREQFPVSEATGGVYMIINVIGRQLEITPAIKTYTEDRLQAFSLFSTIKISGINATLEHSKGRFQVTLVLNCKYHTLTANTGDFDLYRAFDAAADKLESQCVELKEKIHEHRAEPISQTDIKQNEA